MHDFVSYLFYLLQRGMRFAVPAALICGLILAVCYAVCRKKGRRFPWGKAVCAVLLVGWAAVTVFVTLLRSEPNEFAARQWNLQLFRAWREAYQRFTLQIWLNVLLNIALFVPLGVLLPLLWKPFRKWYAALGAGFGVSLLIDWRSFSPEAACAMWTTSSPTRSARCSAGVQQWARARAASKEQDVAALLRAARRVRTRTIRHFHFLRRAALRQPARRLRHDGGLKRRPLVGRLCTR